MVVLGGQLLELLEKCGGTISNQIVSGALFLKKRKLFLLFPKSVKIFPHWRSIGGPWTPPWSKTSKKKVSAELC